MKLDLGTRVMLCVGTMELERRLRETLGLWLIHNMRFGNNTMLFSVVHALSKNRRQ